METAEVKELTATGVVYAGPCKMTFITGYSAAADVEITLHDNAAAAAGKAAAGGEE